MAKILIQAPSIGDIFKVLNTCILYHLIYITLKCVRRNCSYQDLVYKKDQV